MASLFITNLWCWLFDHKWEDLGPSVTRVPLADPHSNILLLPQIVRKCERCSAIGLKNRPGAEPVLARKKKRPT